MDSSELKTREDIEALKQSWVYDPIWDIEDTPGFELHREELLTFHLRMRVKWDAKRARREALEGKRPFIKVGERYFNAAHISAIDTSYTDDNGAPMLRLYTDEGATPYGVNYYNVKGAENIRRVLSWLDAISYDVANEDE